MRTVSRLAYVLLVLLLVLLIGWVILWFAGRTLFFREVEPHLNAVGAAGFTYEAQGHGLRGFPFSYSVKPAGGEVRDGPGAPIWAVSEATRAHVFLPGTVWGLLTSGTVGPRIYLEGQHTLLGTVDVTFASGWMHPKFSKIGLQDGTATWDFDGVDFAFRNMTVRDDGAELLNLERLSLVMAPLAEEGEAQGYSYDFTAQGLSLPEGTFNRVPNSIDGLTLRGSIRPQITSDLVLLAETIERDPIGALSLFGERLGQILAAGPGLYLQEGRLTWGDAQLDLTFDAPLNLRLTSASASLNLEGTIAGTTVLPLLEEILREPTARQSGLALPITALRTAAQSYGLDLQNGTPSTFSGTLLKVSRSGFSLLPEGLSVNGRLITGR